MTLESVDAGIGLVRYSERLQRWFSGPERACIESVQEISAQFL